MSKDIRRGLLLRHRPVVTRSLATLLAGLVLSACGSSGSGSSANTAGDAALADDGQATVSEPTPIADTPVVDADLTPIAVEFRITVPEYMSDELQLDVTWGQNAMTAAWVVDESWVVTGEFPQDQERRLVIGFFDHYGSTTLATHESNFRTGTGERQLHTIAASEFDTAQWDNDNDGRSNLAELVAGTDPDFADVPGAPDAPAGLTSIEYSGWDLELFWTPAEDEDGIVVGYDVYKNDEEQIAGLDALSYYDGNVRPETDYTYDVYAVDNQGNRSRSATVLITTQADEPTNGVGENIATLRGGESASWWITDGVTTTNGTPSGGSCSFREGAGTGIGVDEAWLPDQGDAFSAASMLWVNGQRVGGWLRSTTESTSNYASVPIAGLQVATEYHAVSTQAVLRHYTSFTNESDEDIFVVVNFVNNFGSDSQTRVQQSSSGDLAFDVNDRWIVTNDGRDSRFRDVTNTTVFYGPDAPASVSRLTSDTVFNCSGTQGASARLDVIVPAGERRALMFFHGISPSGAEASARALQYNTTPAPGSPLVEGLSQQQLSELLNWRY